MNEKDAVRSSLMTSTNFSSSPSAWLLNLSLSPAEAEDELLIKMKRGLDVLNVSEDVINFQGLGYIPVRCGDDAPALCNECTPLLAVISRRFTRIAELLIVEHKADVNVQCSSPWETPLKLACTMGLTDLARTLIERGHADVNLCNPARTACSLGNLDMVKLLDENRAILHMEQDVPISSASDVINSPFFAACAFPEALNVVKYLVNERGMQVNQWIGSFTPLVLACCQANSMEMVDFLINQRHRSNYREAFFSEAFPDPLDVTISNRTANLAFGLHPTKKVAYHCLMGAARNGNVGIFDFIYGLIPARSSPPEEFWINGNRVRHPDFLPSPQDHLDMLLLDAIESGHYQSVEFLLTHTVANVNQSNDPPINSQYRVTPAFLAVKNGFCDILELLFRKGARDDLSELFMIACEGTSLPMVELLLAKGADVTNVCGALAFGRAVQSGNLQLMRLLVDRGHRCANHLQSLEHAFRDACLQTNVDVLRYLLEVSGDFLIQEPGLLNSTFYTAVTANYSEDGIRLLVGLGADVNSVFDDGDQSTPFLIAYSRRFINLMRVLLSLGADPSPIKRNWREMPNVSLEFAKFLLENSLAPDQEVLFQSCRMNFSDPNPYTADSRVIEYVISRGNARINGMDRNGRTALGLAYGMIDYGTVQATLEVCRTLLELGADPNVPRALDSGIGPFLIVAGCDSDNLDLIKLFGMFNTRVDILGEHSIWRYEIESRQSLLSVMSAGTVPRLGRNAECRVLPTEIWQKVKAFLVEPLENVLAHKQQPKTKKRRQRT